MGSTIGVPMGVGMLMLMVMITTFFFLATAFVMRMCMRRAISMLVSMRVRVIMVVIAAVILVAAWRMIMRMRLAIRVGMCMGMAVSSHDNLLRWLSGMKRVMRSTAIIPRGWFLCNHYITNAVRSLMIVAVTTTAVGMTMPFSATTALFLAAAVIGGAMIGMVCPPAIMAVVPGRRRNTMISLWHHLFHPFHVFGFRLEQALDIVPDRGFHRSRSLAEVPAEAFAEVHESLANPAQQPHFGVSNRVFLTRPTVPLSYPTSSNLVY